MKEYPEDYLMNNEGNVNLDFKNYFVKIKENWKRLLWWALASAVIGVLIALSIPRKYSTLTKLAPELSNNAVSRLTSLSQLAGLNSSILGTTDAVYPMVYPDIVSSTDFIADLFDTPVSYKDKRAVVDTTLYEFFLNGQKTSVIGVVLSAPMRAVGWVMDLIKGEKEEKYSSTEVDPFHLTKEQYKVAKQIGKSIEATIDKKTMVVTIIVTMQDPLVSATVAKAVNEKLEQYVTAYRTKKALMDLEYYEKLYAEAKEEYYTAQNRYSRYVDYNQGMALQSVRVEQVRLQNEANLKYQLYNNISQQLQSAQAKVQQETPVFVEVVPPTVPLKASKPSKKTIVLIITLLGVIAGCCRIVLQK